MTVDYEWGVETVATADGPDFSLGDVIDHCRCSSYRSAVKRASLPAETDAKHVIVLVRTDYFRRAWSYIVDGRLPEFFEDANGRPGPRVPARFHAEVSR